MIEFFIFVVGVMIGTVIGVVTAGMLRASKEDDINDDNQYY
jgi:hypothetical protein